MSEQQQRDPRGWLDQHLVNAMRAFNEDTEQHRRWWQGTNNGVSKCWLMQDGRDPAHTRYRRTDGAPWAFVHECKESSLPMGALDTIYAFSPHWFNNMRGSVVPTFEMVPRVDMGADGGRRWRVVGILKKKKPSTSSILSSVGRKKRKKRKDDDDDDEGEDLMEDGDADDSDDDDDDLDNYGQMDSRHHNNMRSDDDSDAAVEEEQETWKRELLHNIDLLNAGMPALSDGENAGDLENVAPVRIEAWIVKVRYREGGKCMHDAYDV